MKTKKIDLEIDTIGGLSSLTVAEEKALSDFFQKKKMTKEKRKKETKYIDTQYIYI